MHITRILEEKLAAKVDWKKALILLGPRQVGKSTLVNRLARDLDPDFLFLNGDEIQMES